MPFFIVRDLNTGRIRLSYRDPRPTCPELRAAGPYPQAKLAKAALARRDVAMLQQLFDGVKAAEALQCPG
jgi:hypothetical protein